MKTVKLKKITSEEWQVKKIMLKANGQFDENSLKLLEIVVQNGVIAELNDKQIEFLKSISLIEADLKEKAPEMTRQTLENKNIANSPLTTDYIRQEHSKGISNESVSVENSAEEIIYATPNSDVDEIDATVVVNVSEQEKNKKQEEKQERKFVPTSPEDIANMPPEEVKKMFYLTPERIIESMKMINNGMVWENLAHAGSNATILQSAIEDAYRSCVYPGDLTDPNFLDERISHYLPNDNQAVHFKELHMAALMGTFVGYHVEKNEGDINSLDANGAEKSNVAIVKFPTIVDEMPETLKEQTQKDLVIAIKRRIEDIMNMPNSYKALTLLVPIEETMDKAILDYSENLQDTNENKSTRAYIKSIRTDMAGKMKNNLDDLNVSMDLYGIDWENPNTRKSVVSMIETLQGQGRENEVTKLVEEINMSFTVNSISDLAAVDKACADLAKLSDEGVEVNIAFKLPPEEITNEVLQQKLNDVVDKYDNISRDKTEETKNNTIDEVIESGVEYSLGNGNLNNKQLGEIMVQSMINNLSMTAISIEEIQQEREDDEIGYFNRPIGGGF